MRMLQVGGVASFLSQLFKSKYKYKISKCEGTVEVEYAHNFRKCADTVGPNQNYQDQSTLVEATA